MRHFATPVFAFLALVICVSPARLRADPELGITRTGDQVKLSWPITAYNFGVETATDLDASASWTNLPGAPSLTGGEASVTLSTAGGEDHRFFRLTPPARISIFQFAVFFHGLLEFTWAAPLTFGGRVHANSNIFVGSVWPSTFQDLVTTTGLITAPSWAGFDASNYTGAITFASGSISNVAPLLLTASMIGSATAAREIINPPPLGEDVNSPLGRLRYYNLAGMDLLISNTTVTAIIKSAADDAAPIVLIARYYPTNTSPTNYTEIANLLPFLRVTNRFMDQREGRSAWVSQIDVGRFNLWANTNLYTSPTSPITKHPADNPLSILYVSHNRTMTATQFAAVRLTNGLVLPATGLTLATPNPLYVYGHYNCTDPVYLGSTNTSATFPASLVADSLTILSWNWQDSQSALSLGSGGKNSAGNTTVNAGLIVGMVYSSGSNGTSPFSGGMVNLPRLLESWTATTLTINGSFACLYPSAQAIGPWQSPGTYANSPSRNFSFDQNFRDPAKLPPGTPFVSTDP